MPLKGNWPTYPFTKWERQYIARRVLEHANVLTPTMFDHLDGNSEYAYGFPRRPSSDMPAHYTVGYLDEFSSYIIGIGMKAHRAGLREAILGRLNE